MIVEAGSPSCFTLGSAPRAPALPRCRRLLDGPVSSSLTVYQSALELSVVAYFQSVVFVVGQWHQLIARCDARS